MNDDQKAVSIDPNDLMSEAGRKILKHHFETMLQHEAGTRVGKDIEELHDMRVAARRARAILSVLRSYYQKDVRKAFNKNLRALGHVLGAVRDLDVFFLRLQVELDEFAEFNGARLEPLILFLEEKRTRARKEMLGYLDSQRYSNLQRDFGNFVNTPFAGVRETDQDDEHLLVQHQMPIIFGKQIDSLKEYDAANGLSVEQLHSLRINIKKLRYTIENFQTVIDEDCEQIIEKFKGIQDFLGNLNDVNVAIRMIKNYLGENEQAVIQTSGKDIQNYLQFKQSRLEALKQGFPEVWNQFRDSGFYPQIERLGKIS